MFPTNPHDTFIKKIFSNRDDAISFFESTLPKDVQEILDLKSLEETKQSFVRKNQNPTQTDILWKIPTRSGKEIYTYLLFEHKSYYDPDIFVQVLGYLVQIYSWQKENGKELIPVIPFVFYHGEKKWDLGFKFSDQFGGDENLRNLSRYLPDFELELFDLSSRDISKEFEQFTLRIFLNIIQKIRADLSEIRPVFVGILKELSQVEAEAKKVEILEKLLHYLFSAREKDGKEFRNEEYYKVEGLTGAFMTVLDELRAEGELKGKLKGKLEGKLEDAEKMLAKGISLLDVLDVTGLTEVDLRQRGLIS